MAAAASTAEAIQRIMAEDDGISLVRPEVGALEAITRSEVAMQLDSAHRWPRSPTKCLKDAMSLATMSVEIAESCMYSVPRGGKMITGPSVRLAEMMASSWGNLHVGARVIDATETEVIAQSVCWDLEKNVRITVEAQRSIVGKKGRFDDDMIRVTGMAAISIALRNAVFRVIPRAYVDTVYEMARQCAVGDVATLVTRRDGSFDRYAKLGVSKERVLARLGIAGVDDFTLLHQELLVGMYTSLKSGELSIDDAFPSVGPAPSPVPEGTPEGKRVRLPGSKRGAVAPSAAPVAAPAQVAVKAAASPAPAAKAAPKAANDFVPISGAAAVSPATPKPGDLSWPAVQAELGKADPVWLDQAMLPVIMVWSQDQMRAAYDWAVAFNDDTTEDADLPERPYFTLIERPGEG